MKKDTSVPIADNKNYCVIYQQSPSYFRQLKNQKQGKRLQDDPYCPTLYYGYNMTNHNYLESTKLTRTDQTYLKEARFASSQLGNLSLMTNIYDVAFDITERKVNTMFYPGNIINIIITDFEGGASTRWNKLSEIRIDESDPHKKGTLANTLGIGGYHIIKSVTYTLNNLPQKNIKVSIATKFTGTDAITDGKERPAPKTPYADEPAECIKQYNDALDNLRATETKTELDAADFDRIYEVGGAASATGVTTSGQTQRVSSVTNELDDNDPRVQDQKTKEADEETVKKSAAGTPAAALEGEFNYNQVAGFSVGTVIKGSTVSTALFKDKILRVKSIKNNKANSTSSITWSVGTYNSKDKFIKEKDYKATHTNGGP